jgi:hypothetical protein
VRNWPFSMRPAWCQQRASVGVGVLEGRGEEVEEGKGEGVCELTGMLIVDKRDGTPGVAGLVEIACGLCRSLSVLGEAEQAEQAQRPRQSNRKLAPLNIAINLSRQGLGAKKG